MKNPLRVLSSLFPGTGQPAAAPTEAPPLTPENDVAIKVEVPVDVVEGTSIRPKLPRESYKQHNREIEQRVKAANLHRPVTPRAMPHARGR